MLTDLADDLFLSNCLWEQRLASYFSGIESPRKRKLGVDTLDTVSRVDVLDQGNLVAGCSSLTGRDGGISKEKLPDLQTISYELKNSRLGKLTLYHLAPYLALTLSWLAIQFLYHLQRVAE